MPATPSRSPPRPLFPSPVGQSPAPRPSAPNSAPGPGGASPSPPPPPPPPGTSRFPLIALASLVLLLPGCASLPFVSGDVVPADWGAEACDPSGADGISRDAPLAAGLRDPPATIAASIGDVLGDPVTAAMPTQDDERFPRWATQGGGTIDLSILPSGAFFMAVYRGPAPVDRHVVERLLDRWQVDTDRVWMGNGLLVPGDPSDGPAFQMALDLPVGWANGGATWSSSASTLGQESLLTVLPFYDLPAAPAGVPAEQALATGATYGLCRLGEKGLTPESGYRRESEQVIAVGVLHGSLGYIVDVRTTGPDVGCGPRHSEWVYVDAGTGAVLGSHAEPCV